MNYQVSLTKYGFRFTATREADFANEGRRRRYQVASSAATAAMTFHTAGEEASVCPAPKTISRKLSSVPSLDESPDILAWPPVGQYQSSP